MTIDQARKQTQDLYIAYFGRAADPEGLDFYVQGLVNETNTVNDIADSFGLSAEAQGSINSLTTQEFIEALYQQSFARQFDDASDGTFWLDAINSGAVTKERAFIEILNGAQGNDKVAADNKAIAAQEFTDVIEQAAYDLDAAPLIRQALAIVDETPENLALGIQQLINLAGELNDGLIDPVDPVDPDEPVTFTPEEAAKQTQDLYIAYFGRPADPSGLEFYVQGLVDGTSTVSEIANSFGASNEAQASINSLTTEEFIETLYLQSFGRAYNRDIDGTFWLDAINGGAVTKEQAFIEILNGAVGNDKLAADNKAVAAQVFTDIIMQAEYTAAASPQIAQALSIVDHTPENLALGIQLLTDLANSLNAPDVISPDFNAAVEPLYFDLIKLLDDDSEAVLALTDKLNLIDGGELKSLSEDALTERLEDNGFEGLSEIVTQDQMYKGTVDGATMTEFMDVLYDYMDLLNANIMRGVLSDLRDAIGDEALFSKMLVGDGIGSGDAFVGVAYNAYAKTAEGEENLGITSDLFVSDDDIALDIYQLMIGDSGIVGNAVAGWAGIIKGLEHENGGLLGEIVKDSPELAEFLLAEFSFEPGVTGEGLSAFGFAGSDARFLGDGAGRPLKDEVVNIVLYDDGDGFMLFNNGYSDLMVPFSDAGIFEEEPFIFQDTVNDAANDAFRGIVNQYDEYIAFNDLFIR